jgi:ribonuclease VapC
LGAVVFIDTSAFVSVLTNEPDRDRFIEAIDAADRRMTSPVVRLETCIVLSSRLDFSPGAAEGQFDRFLEDAGIVEVEVTRAIGVEAVACFTKFGKGRHSARLNFADCLSYACARAHRATLIFKGDDFARTDVNAD